MKKKTYDKNILRIIDVNLNRTREGMRVCEEILRFVSNDSYLTKRLKAIRHKVQDAVDSSSLQHSLLCESRNVKEDVGTGGDSLEARESWQSIFFANIQRVKESLRVLEEFFKLFDNRTSERFKELRFEIYEFEKRAAKRSKALSYTKHCTLHPVDSVRRFKEIFS